MVSGSITSMELYPRPERLLVDIEASGFGGDGPVPIETLAQFDQLHYHGTDALDLAIERTGMDETSRVLEVGSGWGGCARWIAHRTGAHVTTVEMQADYDAIGRALTERTGLAERVVHVNTDFLAFEPEPDAFTHVVSWLALFHIPERARYLATIAEALAPGGVLYAEDLHALDPVPTHERAAFDARLFPNSLVPIDEYLATLDAAGLAVVATHDMTADWTAFTAERLAAFRAGRVEYERRHDPATFAGLERFYDGMAGDFARGFVGGLQVMARKR